MVKSIYYNTTLSNILGLLAPPMTKTIKVKPLVLWYNDDIRDARRERRKAERRWHPAAQTWSCCFQEQKELCYLSYERGTETIQHFSNQKYLVNATRKLLKQEKDNLQLANEKGDFFVKKICYIHSRIDIMTEKLPCCDLVSPANSCESVATTETFATYRKQS